MSSAPTRRINVLAVAYWPLGGIRTYMKYTYRYLPKNVFKLTVIARETHEHEALRRDAEEIGARLILAKPIFGRNFLCFRVFQLLFREKFDIIQSHGFISAAHAYIANTFFRVLHILTVHGIVEEHLLGKGLLSILKRRLLEKTVNRIDVVYGVSEDILEDVAKSIRLGSQVKRVVIHNGIDTDVFRKNASYPASLREKLGIPKSSFLIGFLGRFMPQKGFNFLIDAAEILAKEVKELNDWKVLAIGSGDFSREYKRIIKGRGLEDKFIFIPFQRDIVCVYKIIDLIAMPSVWEAFGLQAAEAMCVGVPIIVSDCIGLRETVKGTPAITFPSKDPSALAEAIRLMMVNYSKDDFDKFRDEAVKRFDVRRTSMKVAELFKRVYFDHCGEKW